MKALSLEKDFAELELNTKCVVEMEGNQTVLHPPPSNTKQGERPWNYVAVPTSAPVPSQSPRDPICVEAQDGVMTGWEVGMLQGPATNVVCILELAINTSSVKLRAKPVTGVCLILINFNAVFDFPKESSTLFKQKFVNLQCPLAKRQHLRCHKKPLCYWMTVLGQDPLIVSYQMLQSGYSRTSSSETSGREQCEFLPGSPVPLGIAAVALRDWRSVQWLGGHSTETTRGFSEA
ncbi:hypothetical protein E2I00_006416 [Balaenoptera physalus]|uniref:Uncharacterized protein n=1 Tax=Balaenoptera physalus TaxID=9770 RepID=A0A6A1QKH4_BALPH|nr:hypothetical protein E2I00_006416 [Balaenoptera physalus]